MKRYALQTLVKGALPEVKTKVIAALKAQGFGLLTEIDVQKTMQEKLGVAFEPYQILGACNPQLAYQALSAERLLGLLLPCNIVLRAQGEAIEVSLLDPEVMFEIADPEIRSILAPLAQEAKTRLQSALEALADK
jgi:uncharacterized protein (DUF302 family)